MVFEVASESDIDALIALLDRANEYSAAKSQGERQWNIMDRVYRQLRSHVHKEEMYVLRNPLDHTVIAAMATSEHDSMWADKDDGTALYIHKFMKDPFAPRVVDNLGALFFDFAASRALALSKSVVRCDVKKSLPRLVAYYEGFGFRPVGTIDYSGTTYVAYLMEVPTDVLRKSAARCGRSTRY